METDFEGLKKALFNHGYEAISDFLGYDYPEDEDKNVTENRMDEVCQQMPINELQVFIDKYVINLSEVNMQNIYNSKLPGFYRDERGAYGIVIGKYYICCFINDVDNTYDVTVDSLDSNGTFSFNLDWESTDDPKVAINTLLKMVSKYNRYI